MSTVAMNEAPIASRFSRPRWRWTLAVASVLLLAYAGWQIKHLIDNSTRLSGNAVIEAIPYTEPVKAAITQKLEGAKGVFQITLLVWAALWGLVITKKDERVLIFSGRHLPELAMFVMANLLFAASTLCYASYTDAMAAVHAQGAVQYDKPEDLTIMDFREPRINDIYVWQVRIWVVGMIVAGLALISAHGLLGGSPQEVSKCDSASPSPS